MLEFANIDEQRKKINKLQNEVRQLVCQLRQSERDIYMLQQKQTDKKARLELEQEGIKDKLSNTSLSTSTRLRSTKHGFSASRSNCRKEHAAHEHQDEVHQAEEERRAG